MHERVMSADGREVLNCIMQRGMTTARQRWRGILYIVWSLIIKGGMPVVARLVADSVTARGRQTSGRRAEERAWAQLRLKLRLKLFDNWDCRIHSTTLYVKHWQFFPETAGAVSIVFAPDSLSAPLRKA